MKKFLLLSSALIAAGPAFAGDRTRVAPVPYTWTGCSIGGHVGAGWDRTTYSDPGTPLTSGLTQNFGPAGAEFIADRQAAFLGGVQAGCDYQFANHWVIGIGGDFSWTDMSTVSNDPFFGGKNGNPVVFHSRTDQIATVTGRLGYAVDTVLLYGKGGAAYSRDKYITTNSNGLNENFLGCQVAVGAPFTGCDTTGSTDRWGWTIGFGAEWAFAQNWSAFAEFDHYGFDNKTLAMAVTNAGAAIVTPANLTIRHDIDTVKVGVNYRFGFPGGRY
jgi:outer membrane immunogenic protein